MRNRDKERGSQVLEFTLIGLPLTFLLFSIANMCFAMLTMHTLQEAVEQGTRYVATRGSTCSSGSNSCTVKVQDIANTIATNAAGVSIGNMNVSLVTASGTTTSCSPVYICLSTCSGASCLSTRSNTWPSGTDATPGKDIIITADCPVTAPMSMFWTGVAGSTNIGTTHFYAYSRQRLMF